MFHEDDREVEAALRDVSYDHLEAEVTHARKLGRERHQDGTKEAEQLLYTADALIMLRKMLLMPRLAPQPLSLQPRLGSDHIPWDTIIKQCEALFEPNVLRLLHPASLPELKLFEATAEDYVLCNIMQEALRRGGPSGQPGNLDVSTIDLGEISVVLGFASKNRPKTVVAAQLFNACRDIETLRGHVKRTRHEDPHNSAMATEQVRRIVSTRIKEEMDIQTAEAEKMMLRVEAAQAGGDVSMGAGSVSVRNSLRAVGAPQLGTCAYPSQMSTDVYPHGWAYCSTEVVLLDKDLHINELRRLLTEAIKAAGPVYTARNTVSLEKLKGVGIGGSPFKPDDLPLQKLEKALKYSHEDLRALREPIKDHLQSACEILLNARRALNARPDPDWAALEGMEKNPSLYNQLATLSYPTGDLATREYTHALRELTSHKVVETLTRALQESADLLAVQSCERERLEIMRRCLDTPESWEGRADLPAQLHPADHQAGSNSAPEPGSSGGGGASGTDYNSQTHRKAQHVLDDALAKCQPLGGLGLGGGGSSEISRAAGQWLEIATHVQMLREGLAAHDSKKLKEATNWFKSNNKGLVLCVGLQIQKEAEEALDVHTNNSLETGLTDALQTGKPTGSRGSVDPSTIETKKLDKFVRKARDFKHKNATVAALAEAGEGILALRKAIQLRDMGEVHRSLQAIQASSSMLPIILDEVRIARCELDDEITVSALVCAIGGFDSFSDKRCIEALLRKNNLEIVGNAKFNQRYKEKATYTDDGHLAIPHDLYSYPYCAEGAGEIDPAEIGTDILDEALDIVHVRGLYTPESKKLLKTARLLRALRGAMKVEHWEAVQDLLLQAGVLGPAPQLVLSSSLRAIVDRSAEKEIVVIASQLELRSAMVGVTKCLRAGQASVNFGIIDKSRLDCSALQVSEEQES